MNYKQQLKNRIVKQFGEPNDLDQLARAVIGTIDLYKDSTRSKTAKHKVVGFAWEIRYGNVSNTHDCPIDGKSNWGGRDPDTPTSYPGWSGRVWIRYSNEHHNGFGSDPFHDTLTYPGTGGWGGYEGPFQKISSARFARYGHTHPEDSYPEPQVYSWDYRFYEADWPGVKEWVEKQKIIAGLTDRSFDNSHRFEWWDPSTRSADDQFLKERETIYAFEQHKKRQFG